MLNLNIKKFLHFSKSVAYFYINRFQMNFHTYASNINQNIFFFITDSNKKII